MPKSGRRAEQLAQKALKEANQVVPVDVSRVAQHYGLGIHLQELEDAVSGMLVIRDSHAVIGVNQNHHPNRQRFTIAHEIGHYLLHADQARVFIENLDLYRDELSSNGTSAREIEANAFAAELLMPTFALRKLVKGQLIDAYFDEHIIRRLAAKFGVSTQAITVKLSRLGLIK
jgi:Zn-dependent peptidase ImmA (M78 family)